MGRGTSAVLRRKIRYGPPPEETSGESPMKRDSALRAAPASTASVLMALALLLLIASPVTSQQRAADLTPVTTVEGITEYQLDNGLRVLLFPDPSKPQVTVNITYFVGSRHEGYGETGMAHLLEHMVFKGTPTHTDIMQELTERGANPNGTT